jgi:L-iditol 2-dehydrogenase
MKALVYTEPNVLLCREEPEPTPGNDEVLVRVEAVGICGSDMHAYHGHDSRRPPPFVLGHEAAGLVVSGPGRGARVAVNPLVPCGVCDWCLEGRPHLCPSRQLLSVPPRAGAFAELVRVPEANVVTIPEGLDSAKAALTEPLAVAYHAVNLGARLLARPLAASRCLVLGGGGIGIACALVLAMQGAAEIHIGEPNAARRQTAARAGPFQCYAPDAPGEPAKLSMDLVIDAVGRGNAGRRQSLGQTGRRDRSRRSIAGFGRFRRPQDHAAGNHCRRHLLLHTAGIPPKGRTAAAKIVLRP